MEAVLMAASADFPVRLTTVIRMRRACADRQQPIISRVATTVRP